MPRPAQAVPLLVRVLVCLLLATGPAALAVSLLSGGEAATGEPVAQTLDRGAVQLVAQTAAVEEVRTWLAGAEEDPQESAAAVVSEVAAVAVQWLEVPVGPSAGDQATGEEADPMTAVVGVTVQAAWHVAAGDDAAAEEAVASGTASIAPGAAGTAVAPAEPAGSAAAGTGPDQQLGTPVRPHVGWFSVSVTVPIHAAGTSWVPGTATLLGAPAPVAAPEVETVGPAVGPYGLTVTPTSPAAGLVEAFLRAYLLGEGDVVPLSSPDADFRPAVPTDLSDVQVVSVSAIGDADTRELLEAETPATSPPVELLAVVRVTAGGGIRETQVPLQLRARDQRWEVAAVHPGPLPDDRP